MSARTSLGFSLIFATALAFPVSGQEAPWHGFEPATVGTMSEFFSKTAPPPTTFVREVILLVKVKANGKATTVAPITAGDSAEARFVRDFLLQLEYRPAIIRGKPSASILPVKVALFPRGQKPEFTFAGARERGRFDDLGQLVLTFNKIQPPEIEYFPRYFFVCDSSHGVPPAQNVVIQLDLTAQGKLSKAELWHCDRSGFEGQVLTASRFARFRPAVVRGDSVAVTAWLVVTLFPEDFYPTAIYPFSDSSSSDVWEKNRLKLVTDTVGLMQPPVPRRREYAVISEPGEHVYLHDTISAMLTVDTSGQSRISYMSQSGAAVQGVVNRFERRLQFYPARGFDFRHEPFQSAIYLVFVGGNSVRMVLPWLDNSR